MSNINTLAQNFIDATVNKWGTDEEAVYQIMKIVHDENSAGNFEIQVFNLLTEDQKDYFTAAFNGSRLIPAILQDEMWGSELARASDLYNQGQETFSASGWEYFLEGMASPFDWSNRSSQVAVVSGVVLLGGLAVISAPVATLVSGVLVVGTAVYGVGGMIKNGAELITSESNQEYKENWRDMGQSVAITATAAPFVPKGIQMTRSGARALATSRVGIAASTAVDVTTATRIKNTRGGEALEAEVAQIVESGGFQKYLNVKAVTVDDVGKFLIGREVLTYTKKAGDVPAGSSVHENIYNVVRGIVVRVQLTTRTTQGYSGSLYETSGFALILRLPDGTETSIFTSEFFGPYGYFSQGPVWFR